MVLAGLGLPPSTIGAEAQWRSGRVTGQQDGRTDGRTTAARVAGRVSTPSVLCFPSDSLGGGDRLIACVIPFRLFVFVLHMRQTLLRL